MSMATDDPYSGMVVVFAVIVVSLAFAISFVIVVANALAAQ